MELTVVRVNQRAHGALRLGVIGLMAGGWAVLALPELALGEGGTPVPGPVINGAHRALDEGQRIYEKANCVGCHKWHGDGGGGYGGAALSLRATQLTRDEIVEIVHCGRPGTGMPRFDREAYKDYRCYSGISVDDIGKDLPPDAATFLRPMEIEKVVDYVLKHIKGKGPTSYQDCIDFYGDSSRACEVYKNISINSQAIEAEQKR
ncbi:c-type cytochrome [Bradyrhizobium yuanmingense]|uniref:c-type cytochrome n=1 Tax=Bradyrhizobium yuanmingense TaxID=108015 RepID=UPI0023B9F118|nr:cytochrome c [Bradyrhizobium yuanmingense]MDF0498379.1 cytochrome c [Bradyrhizobium yuanmingense]